MSECSLCDNYDEYTHPVSFRADLYDPRTPDEIKPYLGLGHYLDDLDASDAADEFWEGCARLCHDCFRKYNEWITWWG